MSEVWGHAIFVFSQFFPTIIFPDILEFSPLTFIFLVLRVLGESVCQNREIDMARVLRKCFLS